MKLIIALLTFLFFNYSVVAQKQIEIVSADESEFFLKPKPLRIGKGNVHIIHNETHLYCDSVVLFEKENEFKAYGNVFLEKGDSIDLSCNELLYNGNSEIAYAKNKVELRKDTVILYTEKLTYNIKEEVAYYKTKGKIINQDDKILSKQGNYFLETNKVVFTDDVQVYNKEFNSTSDYLSYNTITKDIEQKNNVHVKTDSSDISMDHSFYNAKNQKVISKGNVNANYSNYTIKCDSLEIFTSDSILYAWDDITIYNKTDNSTILAQRSILNKIESKGYCAEKVYYTIPDKDTTFIKSDSIYFYKKNKLHLYSFKNTKMYKNDIQFITDSLYLNRAVNRMFIYKKPICWLDKQEIKSDSMHVKMYNNTVDSLFLYGHVFLIQEEEKEKKLYSQLKGRKMLLNINDKNLEYAWVYGNVEVLFCVKEENKITGLNKMLGAELEAFFYNKELKSTKMSQNIEAKMIPVQYINEKNKYLAQFLLKTHLKVKRSDFKLNNLY